MTNHIAPISSDTSVGKVSSQNPTVALGPLNRLWQTKNIREQTKGVFWKLMACTAFAFVNAFVRYLTGGAGGVSQPLPAGVVVLFQNIFGCLIMVPFVLKDGVNCLKTTRIKTHAIRVISAVLGIIALYTALSRLPMAQVVALQFTGPIFTVIGAKLYLKERVGVMRFFGIVLGMLGAFVLTRPDKAFSAQAPLLDSLVVFFPLASAALFVVAKLCARHLGAQGEKPQLLALYLLFFMIPVSGLYALGDWVTPSTTQLFMLFALGGSGCLAHYATARAYTHAEVLFLTPFGFTRLILTAVLGYCLFGEFPKNEGIWLAILCIVISVLVITWGEAKIKMARSRAAA